MAAFQAKTDWKTLKKRENKNYRFVSFLPGAEQKMPKKKGKKIKKIKKIPLWHHFKPKQIGTGREREQIKIVFLFCSYPTGNRNFQKKRKKN